MLVINNLDELLLPCVYVFFHGDEPIYIGASGFKNRWTPGVTDSKPKKSGILRVLEVEPRMPKRVQARQLSTRTEICFYRKREEALYWERKLIHGVHPRFNTKCDGYEDGLGLHECYWPGYTGFGQVQSPFEIGPPRTRQMLEALGWPLKESSAALVQTTF